MNNEIYYWVLAVVALVGLVSFAIAIYRRQKMKKPTLTRDDLMASVDRVRRDFRARFDGIREGICEADEIRNAMREAYQRHYDEAIKEKMGDESPHYFGLYGALASRYVARMRLRGDNSELVSPALETIVWPEVTPFMLMSEKDAVEAIAEHVVYQENPSAARVAWLKKMINDAIRMAEVVEDSPREMVVGAFFQGKAGWIELLEPDVKVMLENDLKQFARKYRK